ncbi:xanthine dehydrogenase family Fe-S subunit [Azospirillum picis]|uniref:Carbon-monoxide dehydrogenase small subunit n=1 Tax=Azospirillum picis TaxID=488438 RepID=A0ABU0MVE4_9PROT|nr:2Fe-2S iron-sulfur cluster-binding protein [Azospirillum picis]MBP2303385.1 carbon-monoxide dehydrogenase small subunit [Azospirillum picis]MDQ0537289.1 carbon-monoxide dehydrogenase small subunit [Azospirillum picis]
MNRVSVTIAVNGQPFTASIEPRQHLADFLRETVGLTGTHLGCEQGVCGACTVEIDGRPQRSCIAFAAACDGSSVRTVEGFDDDPTMQELREAFSTHHGLQCGFCTPGMLITSRDIVRRCGETDERTIREELSGNLCRCTGYMGIVAAVGSVCRGKAPQVKAPPAATPVRAAAVHLPEPAMAATAPRSAARPSAAPAPAAAAFGASAATTAGDGAGWTAIDQSITVAATPDAVWEALGDVRRVASCLPGAEVETLEGEALTGRMSVRFGPIKARFAGEGTVRRDEPARTGRVTGAGRDSGSGSQAAGEVVYRVAAAERPDSTTVAVTIRYRLTGTLAQFSRGALVQDFVRRMAETFAANLSASLAPGADGIPPQAVKPAEMNVLAMLVSVVAGRIRRLFAGR